MHPEVENMEALSKAPLGLSTAMEHAPEGKTDSLSCPTPINGALHESPFLEKEGGFSFMHPPFLKGGHETEFRPVPVSDFLAEQDEAVDWVLEDYFPAGGLVIGAGKPKEGKTTFFTEAVVRIAKGQPFLWRSTAKGGVLILALEEHRRDVRMRLGGLGVLATDPVHIHVGPLAPSSRLFESLKTFVLTWNIRMILVDTLAAFWKIDDENDAAAMTKAVKPLLALARDSKACVLLIHHARKSDGSYGDEIRGSGALFALADVALIMKRHEVENQRKLVGVSRYPETPRELIIELRESGYVALGDPSLVNKTARRAKVKAALTSTPEEAAAIIKRSGVSFRDGQRLLAALAETGEAIRTGHGKKGSPYLYACNPTVPCMNGNVEVISDVA